MSPEPVAVKPPSEPAAHAIDTVPMPTMLKADIDAVIAMIGRGEPDQAKDRLDQLVLRWPGRPEPHMNLAALAARRHDLIAARTHLEAALKTEPTYARAFELLQAVTAEQARQAYARALALPVSPGNDLMLPWTAAGAAASEQARPLPLPPKSPPLPQAPVDASFDVPGALQGAHLVAALLAITLAAGAGVAWAQSRRPGPVQAEHPPATPAAQAAGASASPEARLIDVYRLIGASRMAQALAAAESLARDVPGFSVGQLVYGDLLLAQTGSLLEAGAGASTGDPRARASVHQLQRESLLRLQALQDEPPPATWPSQILQLAHTARHLVAVDTSRARLYVIQNRPEGPRLVAHHYVSIGSAGTRKQAEGDLRTPLGVYYITSRLEARQLGDLYGAGALPLNYPNDHDRRLGRTGANIWLHGTPSGQYARAPRATNGCVVLANDDLTRWLHELAPRSTPVLIAERLDWVTPRASAAERQVALSLAETWRRARAHEDVKPLMALYSQHFDNGESGYAAWRDRLVAQARESHGRERTLEDVSAIAWKEQADMLVITFTEVLRGASKGETRRQYWSRESGQWRIFSEGVLE